MIKYNVMLVIINMGFIVWNVTQHQPILSAISGIAVGFLLHSIMVARIFAK